MKLSLNKYYSPVLWTAILLTLSATFTEATETNQINPITGEYYQNGINKVDVTSLNQNLNEVSSIEVKLFPNDRSITFRKEPTDTKGWIGREGESMMKLVKNDRHLSGSITMKDKMYIIDTLQDGSTHFRDASRVKVEGMIPSSRALSSVNCDDSETAFKLDLTTDNFGFETKWKLTDSDGNLVQASNQYESNKNYVVDSCLDNSVCHTFTIYDHAEDGICCDFGHGGYSITYDGKQVASDQEKFRSMASYTMGKACEQGKHWYDVTYLTNFMKKKNSKTHSKTEANLVQSLPCKSWCDESDVPWIAKEGEQKCDWTSTCAGCSECLHNFEDKSDRVACHWYQFFCHEDKDKNGDNATDTGDDTPNGNATMNENATYFESQDDAESEENLFEVDELDTVETENNLGLYNYFFSGENVDTDSNSENAKQLESQVKTENLLDLLNDFFDGDK